MKTIIKWIAPTGLLLLSLWGLFFGLIDAENTNDRQDTLRLQESIQKAAVECYSIEGRFPKDLSYLKEKYGLVINEEEYSILYRVDGQNLMPDIYVYRKGEVHESS